MAGIDSRSGSPYLSTPPRQVAQLEAVVFDMDGVIIDSHPAHRKAWQVFLKSLGKSVSSDELEFILDGRKRCEILRYFLGDLTPEDSAELGRRKDEFFREAALDLPLIPGVLDLLQDLRLKRLKLGLATSASASRTRSTLRKLQLERYFKVVVTGDDVEVGKPDPAMYHMACRNLAANPQSAVAIEDAVSGVVAAKSAGMHCIGVSRNGKRDQLRQAGASEVIEDFIGFASSRLERLLNPSVLYRCGG